MRLDCIAVVAVALAAAAAVTDVRRGLIPNLLTLPALALALALHALDGGVPGLVGALVGAAMTAALPYLAFRGGGMGGGDVKLLAALGALLGGLAGLELLFVASVAAAAQAVLVLAVRGQLGGVLRNVGRMLLRPFRRATAPVARTALTELRMGPAILVATLWAVV